MSKHTSITKKVEILTWRNAGKTIREISLLTGVSKSSVSEIIIKNNQRGCLERLKGSGRPKMLRVIEKNFLIEQVRKTPRTSTVKLVCLFKEKFNKSISRKTIYNYLIEMGYINTAMVKKPLLSKIQKQKRFEIAEKWLYWDDKKWESVIFSDESKFNLMGSDGKVKIWRKPNEKYAEKNIQGTKKFGGGNIMVWGCFSAKGVGNLVLIENIMDRFIYIDILNNNLAESVRKMSLSDFIFQQDNDPKHTSKYAKEYFDHKNIKVMQWPSQSPDLNPIENIWAYLGNKINEKIFDTKRELFDCLKEEWNNIPVEMCRKLVYSMKNRIKQVIKTKGGYTEY